MTRPLDEVLAAVREMAQDDCIVDGDIRRELEEWEEKLVMTNILDSKSKQLAEVRQLLGRGEPEPIPLNRDGGAPADLEQLGIKLLTMPEGPKKDALRKQIDDALGVAPKPSPASPAMRELMAVAKDLCVEQQMYASGAMVSDEWGMPGNELYCKRFMRVVVAARAAVKLAHAELGEEATNA